MVKDFQKVYGFLKNKMGIKAVVQPLYIIIAKQHHLNKEIFDTIEIGDKVNIEITNIFS